VVTGGSDNTSLNPGIIYRPLDQIEIGHNRQPIDHPEERIMPRPDQRLNLPDLIRSYTLNSAYMLHREQDIGSIRVGKKADLTVLEQNLFAVPRHEIHAVRVMLTMMDGKITHSIGGEARAAQ
jgi:predicted amidohydrolase YtcJ